MDSCNKYSKFSTSAEGLKAVRHKLGYTAKVFAKHFGVTQKDIENWESRDDLKISNYMRMCKYAGCDIDFLLGVQDMPTRDEDDICKITDLTLESAKVLESEKELSDKRNVILSSTMIVNELLSKNSNLQSTIIDYVNANMQLTALKKNIDNNELLFALMPSAERFYAENKYSADFLTNGGEENLKRMLIKMTQTLCRSDRHFSDGGTLSKHDAELLYLYLYIRDVTDVLKRRCIDEFTKFTDNLASKNIDTYIEQSKPDNIQVFDSTEDFERALQDARSKLNQEGLDEE